MKKKILEKNRGITLIALVITIIVLLILAGISITMLSGDNSILKQAGKSKDAKIISQEKERISISYNSVMIDKKSNGDTSSITEEEFSKAIKSYDEKATTTTERNKFIITYSNGHKYSVYNNGNITEYTTTPYAKDELTVTVSENKVESPYYVNYPSKKEKDDKNEKIKCRVLYNDNTYGLQIISVNPITKVTLGKNDSNENVKGEFGSLERTQNSYNRAITTLNEKAEEYIITVDGSILATDARCVGSSVVNKNYPDNLIGDEKKSKMYIADSIYTYMNDYNGKFFEGDKNYEIDIDRLNKIGAIKYKDTTYGEYYWLASRSVFPDTSMNRFGIKVSNKNGNLAAMNLWNVENDGNIHIFEHNNIGFRPVFILASNVKILGGQGTEENPFEIGL